MIAADPEAYILMHEGSMALAAAETAGMRIDVPKLEKNIKYAAKEMKRMTNELSEMDVGKLWRKTFGSEMNFGANKQLAHILYDKLKYPITNWTKGGKGTKEEREAKKTPAVDNDTLELIDDPFVHALIKFRQLDKAKGTYLDGIYAKQVDGLLHGSFNTNIVATYRLSMEDPNLQNQPKRNEIIARLIRECFISRFGDNGHVLEIDLSQSEVRCGACYHKDPRMLKFIKNGYDYHKEMAARIFLLDLADVPKAVRQETKGGFVFAEFYGSIAVNVSLNMWNAMMRDKFKLNDGTLLVDHLKQKGIKERGDCVFGQAPRKGTFENRVKEEESWFWNEMYPGYRDWKKRYFREFQAKGYFKTLTGFVCSYPGVMTFNQVANYPIQGSSSHWILWVFKELHRYIKKHKMRSRLVNTIHDSIILDAHKNEVDELVAYAFKLITIKLQEHWPWIITPVEAGAEISAAGGNWFEMNEYKTGA